MDTCHPPQANKLPFRSGDTLSRLRAIKAFAKKVSFGSFTPPASILRVASLLILFGRHPTDSWRPLDGFGWCGGLWQTPELQAIQLHSRRLAMKHESFPSLPTPPRRCFAWEAANNFLDWKLAATLILVLWGTGGPGNNNIAECDCRDWLHWVAARVGSNFLQCT